MKRDRPTPHSVDVYAEPKVGGGWFAKCSCGWRGRVFPVRRDAMDDGDEHAGTMARIDE